MNRKVGIVGTGVMGAPMAHNLLAAGYPLQAWNRSPEKLRNVAAAGGEVCDTPAQAAVDVDVLICMLSDGPTCDAVLFGNTGESVVDAMKTGSTLVVMSSIPVETSQVQAERCRERGLGYLDAPVSGGEQGAREATLAIMVGGDAETFSATESVLSAMGRAVHVGPAGTGQQAKLANQMIVASTIATVAEALLFAERGGADPAKVRDALSGGFADSPIMRQHGLRMIEESFAPGGAAKYQLKDTHTAMERAETLGLKLPVATVADELFEAMVEHGDGDLDHSGLIRELRRLNA
ncbi:NAD(P)-dependent oxidoreductase [Aidingimonas halophila]|uniref:3-hydroxyisobutyrate dehydrogenase n=1 Tax=Aidingimonas halophila TaxID=574349 RepID=A0A1H2SMP3_9GAMM|nr:NAD(P)-dependent oxidoreductase [Aidingimonas halophila]GHC17403.1 2-hydroxy-3-oxopropionate reductase [Aidingimonas halophila]SDW32906.1 3-hydroxyisobutyrate dehydrogenase [Aidingimonas halophila]